MNVITGISVNNELKNDLLQVAGSYLSVEMLNQFGKLFINDELFPSIENTELNHASRLQLDIDYNFLVSRHYLDRTLYFAFKNLSQKENINFLINIAEMCIAHGMLRYADEIIRKLKRMQLENSALANINFIKGDILARSGKWEKSLEFINKAKELYSCLNDKFGLAKCYNITGCIAGEQGNLNDAKINYDSCYSLAVELQNSEMKSLLEINLGIICIINEEFAEAQHYFDGALKSFQQTGNHRRICEVKHNLGMLNLKQKKYVAALSELDGAIDIAIKNELNSALAKLLISKTELLIELNELAAAYLISKKAMEVAHLINDRLTIAEVYKIQGTIQRRLKKYILAENSFISALRINKNLGINLNVAECYFELASVHRELGESYKERDSLLNSQKYYKYIDLSTKISEIQLRLEQLIN